ncbi:MAG: hypothetical protein JWO58_2829 [Chitinophagaceae bacterium]|nr:hypothetical protein [Chitinophagaceae bacterium]
MSKSIDIKPYNLKDLSTIYGVCDKTLKKWLVPFEKEIGQKQGRYFNINQVKIIFDKLGVPQTLENL